MYTTEQRIMQKLAAQVGNQAFKIAALESRIDELLEQIAEKGGNADGDTTTTEQDNHAK